MEPDLDSLDALACDLFRTFSRAEFALKAAGFFKNSRQGVQPDWDSFANSLADFLADADAQLHDSVIYLLQQPPKKQALRGNELVWVDKKVTGHKTHQALIYIRRVRNNLFHGGKFNVGWFDESRSRKLLFSSLIVLRACLDRSDKVSAAFHNSSLPPIN